MNDKLWEGRFREKTHALVESFTSSIQIDKRLYREDIEGSLAHVKMLARQGIISRDEAGLIQNGLEAVKKEIESGEFKYDDSLEDIHMHIESRLTDLIGPAAKKLHTGRSRNDQVAVDEKLYLKKVVKETVERLKALRRVFIQLAKDNIGVVLPGYTHMQRAQPVLLSHHFTAYYEMFTRDQKRFSDGLTRLDENPLGAAALAGTPYPIDREYTTELLGFAKATENSMDSSADRDFMLEFAACASICMVHLSRLSEELIIWSTHEFGYITLPDAFATGSSIMPQKKNPDVPELIRGKTGRVFGDLMALLTLMKGLPMTYNRDMQEDKEPLFSTVDTLTGCLDVMTAMLPNLTVNRDVMAKAAETGFLNATDLADYLAENGVPFREAHGVSGKAVAYAGERGKELHELTLEELKTFSPAFKGDVFSFLSVKAMTDRRNATGGTAEKAVLAALDKALKEL